MSDGTADSGGPLARWEALRERADRIDMDAAKNEVAAKAKTVGTAAVRKARELGQVSRERVDAGYRTLTLHEYREEVDRTLAEVVQVLLVMDARIRHLEAELGRRDQDTPS